MEDLEDVYSRFRTAHQPVSDLNFATCRKKFNMKDPDPSQGYMELALRPFMHKLALLEAGESLARYQFRNPYDLFASALEQRLRNVMNKDGPAVQPEPGKEPSTAVSLNWADVIREAKQEDICSRADGTYYFLFRKEHSIIMDMRDYATMIILKAFLYPWPPWPHPDDVDKERNILSMEHGKACKFKAEHTEVGTQLDRYLIKLKERGHNLAVYRHAIKDWSKVYFGTVFGLPGESHEAPPDPPIQKREPSHADSVGSVNSIEFDDRGDIEYNNRSDVECVLPGRESFADGSAEDLDDSVSEAPRRRSRVKKQNNPTDASESNLLPIPGDNAWEPPGNSTENNGSDGDDHESDDNKETATKPLIFGSPPSPKRRRIATNYSFSMGVRTRLRPVEKQHGFSLIDSLLKEGSSWTSITDRYNVELGTHRSVESVRAVWDRLSLNPKLSVGATAVSSETEPFTREGSTANTVPKAVSGSTPTANKGHRKRESETRR